MTALSIFLFLGTFALSLWATWRVKAAYSKYSEVPASSGMTGAEVAARIMAASGINDVQIVESNQMLGDHYDPMNKTLGAFFGKLSRILNRSGWCGGARDRPRDSA